MSDLNEAVTKSAQTANLLTSDIREAHSAAIYGERVKDGLAQILLIDLLQSAVEMEQKLKNIEMAIEGEENIKGDEE